MLDTNAAMFIQRLQAICPLKKCLKSPALEGEGPCLGKQRVLPLLDIVISGFAVVRRRILAGSPVGGDVHMTSALTGGRGLANF